MPEPQPPVPINDACSIIHDNVLYVYSPDAFQTLPLHKDAKWSQEPNGVSVTGAVCVKGGIDGDNNQTALYVVGGAANSSDSNYPGLQRYSIQDKSWQTITPVVKVTQHRQYHSAAYMNASSALVVYAGSQNGYTGASSETFLMEMYPPYRVQAYSSIAPPCVQPFMMPWDQGSVLMVGGSSTNAEIFTFDPQNGFVNLGLALPNPPPSPSVAQVSLFELDDASRILQTYDLGQSPASITSNVILNPGGALAQFNETVGQSSATQNQSSTPTATSKARRDVVLNSYPAYNSTNAPSSPRKNFALAQDDNGLVAFVGGDSQGSVGFFNQSQNGWIAPTALLGSQPLSTTSSSHTATPTHTQTTSTPSSSPTEAASHSGGGSGKRGLTILGGVLGGLCGLAAILIIILLWLRNKRRRKRREEKRKTFPAGSKTSEDFGAEQGIPSLSQPLSHQGQPMGRSPVSSTVLFGDSAATGMLATRPAEHLIRRVSSDVNNHQRMEQQAAREPVNKHHFFHKKDRHPPSISRPMNPNLGDYKERPSIDLGRATPSAPVNATPLAAVAAVPARKQSQRKTDEAWAKYFTGERGPYSPNTDVRRPSSPTIDPRRPSSPTIDPRRPSSPIAGRGGGGFWPGSGVPVTARKSPGMSIRDSTNRELQPKVVTSASPNLSKPKDERTRQMSNARGVLPKISSGNSDESDYEDDELSAAFSSGVPASVHDNPWTPVGNTWSGPSQRPVNRPSIDAVGANDFPPPTSSSGKTSHTSGTQSSGIPNFPMPSSTIRSVRASGGESSFAGYSMVQHPAASHQNAAGYHPREPSGYFAPDDMSWLNLGSPHQQHPPENQSP